MNIRLIFNAVIIFLAYGVMAHAQELTVDSFIQNIKSIVDIDFEQEDRLKPFLQEYVTSFNKIYAQIQQGGDKQKMAEKLLKLNDKLDVQLKDVFTEGQLRQWNAEKKDIYKEILAPPNQ